MGEAKVFLKSRAKPISYALLSVLKLQIQVFYKSSKNRGVGTKTYEISDFIYPPPLFFDDLYFPVLPFLNEYSHFSPSSGKVRAILN